MDPATKEWLTRPGGLLPRLTEMRRAAGLTAAQLAEALGGDWTRARVSKVENALKNPDPRIVREWATACGHPEQAAELTALLPGGAEHVAYAERLAQGLAAEQLDWDQWLRQAKTIFTLQLTAIPALAQTPSYAEAMMAPAARWYSVPPEDIPAAVAARIERQNILADTSRDITLIILEAALRMGVADPNVMWAQCDRIKNLAQLPHLTIGIIPLGAPVPLFPMNSYIAADGIVRLDTFSGMVEVTGNKAQNYLDFAGPLLAESLTDWRLAEPPERPDDGAALQLVNTIMDWWAAKRSAAPKPLL
jgi:transcriptional regulator with XRE-family HTH domain